MANLYYLTQSAVKNALYLPLQILLLGFLLQAVLPVMQRQRWLPEQLPAAACASKRRVYK